MNWGWNFFFILFMIASGVILSILLSEVSILIEVDLSLLGGQPVALVWCIDEVSSTFMFMTTFVSGMVFLYSLSYMNTDQQKKGFILMLLLFSLSMILLSISGNLFTALIGWDGLGLTSFCLIIFFQNWSSFNSGLITFLTNRLGDVAMILSLILSSLVVGESEFWVDLGMFIPLLLLGSITKSAQLPFSSWLPRAMAAPTPVSALVHSSTLVTAGVFMIARFSSSISPEDLWWLQLVSILTIVYSGSSSLGEFDLKKIIALSTLSHVSLMFFTVSIGSVSVCILHMIIHAVFKSMLFMVAGVIIHHSGGEQDIRRLSVSSVGDPAVEAALLFSLMSMVGFPFLAGFFSKEMIMALSGGEASSLLFFFTAAGFTSGYSFRILSFLCVNPPSSLLVLGKWSFLFSFGSLCSSILAGVMSPFFLSEGFISMSLLSFGGKVDLLFSLIVGGVLGYSMMSFSKFHVSAFKLLLSSMWMAGGVNSFLLCVSRLGSWKMAYLLDVKGVLDSPLFWGVWETSKKLVSLSFPSPLGVMKVWCVSLIIILTFL